MDGDVTTGLIGFDAEWERLLAGVMLSQSEGDGAYRLDPALGDRRRHREELADGRLPLRKPRLERPRLGLGARRDGLRGAHAQTREQARHADRPLDAHGRGRGQGPGARRHGALGSRTECEVRRHVGRDEERAHERHDRHRRAM